MIPVCWPRLCVYQSPSRPQQLPIEYTRIQKLYAVFCEINCFFYYLQPDPEFLKPVPESSAAGDTVLLWNCREILNLVPPFLII